MHVQYQLVLHRLSITMSKTDEALIQLHNSIASLSLDGLYQLLDIVGIDDSRMDTLVSMVYDEFADRQYVAMHPQ